MNVLSFSVVLVLIAVVHSAPTTTLTPIFKRPSHDLFGSNESGLNLALAGGIWRDMEESFNKMHQAFDDMQKKMEEDMLKPIASDFDLKFDIQDSIPKEVENKTISDERVVDDHIIKTQEKVYSTGNSVVHVKQMVIRPKNSTDLSLNRTDIGDLTPSKVFNSFKNIFNRKSSSTPTPFPSEDASSTPTEDAAINTITNKDVEEVEAVSREPLSEVANELTDILRTSPSSQATEIIDLTGDTDVNVVAENHIRQPDPDAELIDSNNLVSSSTNYSSKVNANQYYSYLME